MPSESFIARQVKRLGIGSLAALLVLALALGLLLAALEAVLPNSGIIAGLVIVLMAVLLSAKIIMARIRKAEQSARMDSHQAEYLLALYRLLDLKRDLPKMRGWAISPDFGHYLAKTIRDRRPETALEMGSGVSTLIMARCMEQNGKGHVYSIEHDPKFAAQTERMLAEYGLRHRATVCVAELANQDIDARECLWYDRGCIPDLERIDLLVIDGPPGDLDKEIRYPALPAFCHKQPVGGLVLLDDYGREGERRVSRKWLEAFPAYRSLEVETEKGLLVLEKTA